ncbi:piggyBac transposable element-derived protein 4 [Biomphalaria glabrata]
MDSDSDYQPETDVDSSDDEVWELIDSSDDSDEENIPPNSTLNATQPNVNYGYDVLDTMPEAPASFLPERVPGIQLDQVRTRDSAKQFFRAIDFFKLYFTMDIVLQICQYTNTYATEHGLQKPSVFQSWYELSPDEFYRFCGLIMYAGIVQVPNIERFWSTKSLYNGLWARAFMSRDRFKAIMCFIKVSNPLTEDPNDKLCKVRMLTTYIRMKCIKLYQPHQNVSIDERMVRNKGKYAFRQYIRDKPTKWGMKLWILADSLSGLTRVIMLIDATTGPVDVDYLAIDMMEEASAPYVKVMIYFSKMTFILFDGRVGMTQNDQKYFQRYLDLQIPMCMVLTKIDLAKPSALLRSIVSCLRFRDETKANSCFPQPFLVSSMNGEGLAFLQSFIAYITGNLKVESLT